MFKLIDYILVIVIIIVTILIGFVPKIKKYHSKIKFKMRTKERHKLHNQQQQQQQQQNLIDDGTGDHMLNKELSMDEFYLYEMDLSESNIGPIAATDAKNTTASTSTYTNGNSLKYKSLNGAVPSATASTFGRSATTTADTAPSKPSFFINSISLVIGFQTTISIVGLPVEFYYYGFESYQFTLCMIIAPILIALYFVPFLYKIKSKSIYEYLDDKFGGSRSVKVFALLIAILFQFLFSTMVLFSTSLSVNHILSFDFNLNVWIVPALLGLLSAVLALMGLRSVVLANFTQYLIMVLCNVVLIFLGIKNLNSNARFADNVYEIWNATKLTGRNRLFVFEENFQHRYTFWNCLLGLVFNTLPTYCLTQQSFMRIKQAKTMRSAKLLVVSMAPFGMLNLTLILTLGFVMFGYFHKCGDPFSRQEIANQNQLLTKFLTQFFGSYHGLMGLYIALLISSALSTLASVLKALSVTLSEDIVSKLCISSTSSTSSISKENSFIRSKRLSENVQTDFLYQEDLLTIEIAKLKSKREHKKILKKFKNKRRNAINNRHFNRKLSSVLIVVSSLVIIAFTVGLGYVQGSLTSISLSFLNSLHGPVLFIYMCAKFNDYSSKRHTYAVNRSLESKLRNFQFKPFDVIMSCVVSIAVLQWLVFGRISTAHDAQHIYHADRRPVNVITQPSPDLVQFCQYEPNKTTSYDGLTSTRASTFYSTTPPINTTQTTPGIYQLYAISFNWFPFIGFFICILQLLVNNLFRLFLFCICKLLAKIKK